MFLVEDKDRRKASTLLELKSWGPFWTIDSELTDSAERFIRETPSEMTLRNLMEGYQKVGRKLPDGYLVCDLIRGSLAYQVLRSYFDIDTIMASQSDRRLDIRWSESLDQKRWVTSDEMYAKTDRRLQLYLRARDQSASFRNRSYDFRILTGAIVQTGLDSFVGVYCHSSLCILQTQPIGTFLSGLLKSDKYGECFFYTQLAMRYFGSETERRAAPDIKREISRISENVELNLDATPEFIESLMASALATFDPHARSGRKTESIIF